MIKLAVIIGGALLMAGVAFAGTRTLLEQTSGPTIDTPLLSPAANTTIRQEDRGLENELRRRRPARRRTRRSALARRFLMKRCLLRV